MNIKILLISLFSTILLGCIVKRSAPTTNSPTNTNELHASNELDFEIIKEWVKGKKIVAIGESTHGLGEFYTLKSELVQYLHKELGFEVLAIEGGFGDINLAWMDINSLDFLTLRNETLFGNFRCQEIEPLFKYIKAQSNSKTPLFYAGFDPQISGNYYKQYLDSICDHFELRH